MKDFFLGTHQKTLNPGFRLVNGNCWRYREIITVILAEAGIHRL
jgi:hypothetical protein